MTDRVEKALKKLSFAERKKIKEILLTLQRGTFGGLQMKKLKGCKDIYRVRKGDMRIIFRKDGDEIFILAVERRCDTTYHDF
jgi:mRNA-degrading endonuclease RelE of RelBE toxin-antitoxin system